MAAIRNRFILFFMLFWGLSCLPGFAQGLQSADEHLFLQMHHWKNSGNEPVFSMLSASVVPAAIGAPASVALIKRIRKDSLPLNESAAIAGAALAGFGFSQALKYVFKRPRPWQTISGVEPVQPVSDRWSMPSGHSSTAFATATALCLEFPQWQVMVPSLLWASSVGVSRIVLGHHYPGDVLAGAALGAGSAWLSHKINQKWHSARRFAKTKSGF